MVTILPIGTSVTTLLPPRGQHLPPAAWIEPGTAGGLLGSVIERLYDEYVGYLPLSEVLDVVSGCLHDLQPPSPAALPELVERLARYRLAQLGDPGRQ